MPDPRWWTPAAYAQLDMFASLLFEKEQQAKQYNELEELFEQPVSRYQEMADTRSDMRLLKNLWDFKASYGSYLWQWHFCSSGIFSKHPHLI